MGKHPKYKPEPRHKVHAVDSRGNVVALAKDMGKLQKKMRKVSRKSQ